MGAFGDKIKTRREELGLSQRKLGLLAGNYREDIPGKKIADTYIKDIEIHDVIPSDMFVIALAKALELDYRQLLLTARMEKAPNAAMEDIYKELFGYSPSDPPPAQSIIENPIPIVYIDVYRLKNPDQINEAGDPQVVTKGNGGVPVGEIEHQIPIAKHLVDGRSFGIFVPDDSMEPRILQNSIAAITPSAPLRSGDICYAMLPGGKQVLRKYKKLGKNVILEGFNEKSETILLTEPEIKVAIFYRMKAVVIEY